MPPAPTAAPATLPLHPLLATRCDLRAFDPAADVTSQELAALLEAARWTSSRDNSQPWRFLVARRGDDAHHRILATLPHADRTWAGRAAVLLVGAHLTHTAQGQPLPHAAYDLGQAVAHLSLQATSLGLHACPLGDVDPDRLHADLGLPAPVRPEVVLAIGRPGDPATLPVALREQAPSQRLRAVHLLLA